MQLASAPQILQSVMTHIQPHMAYLSGNPAGAATDHGGRDVGQLSFTLVQGSAITSTGRGGGRAGRQLSPSVIVAEVMIHGAGAS